MAADGADPSNAGIIPQARRTVETLEGTPIHPIWSIERGDWVPLGELVPGDQFTTPHGSATVLANHILNQRTTVYNIEVHGEHVSEVGELGVLVHNACDEVLELARGQVAMGFMTRAGKLITITPQTDGGHAALILTISGLTARVRNGTAVAFTVMKNAEGALVAMGSGQFPVEGGLTLAMKQLIYGFVR